MPPLSSNHNIQYSNPGDSEFDELMQQFQAGRYSLLTATDSATDAKTYLFMPPQDARTSNYQLPLMYAMMDGVIKGAAAGEFFADYPTYAKIGENALSEGAGSVPDSSHTMSMPESRSQRLPRLFRRLRGQ